MSKIAALLARKPANSSSASPSSVPAIKAAGQADTAVDLDEELFSSIGAQLGSSNETLRNLLLNANHKISELDTIKDAVAKLVSPVSKALREFETEKADKINLQAALSNTRTAYGKLRNEVTDLEKKSASLERETDQLRKDLAFTENAAKALETVRGELAVEIAQRRAQITDLEGRLSQETVETKSLRDENERLKSRQITVDKHVIQVEAEVNTLRQKLVLADDERRALQTAYEKSAGDVQRLARKLAETENTLSATHSRLRNTENSLAEMTSERGRLSAALDEATERQAGELTKQQMRFDALQARSNATDRLLTETREHLSARSEDVRILDRRLSETTLERDTLATRLSSVEAELMQRDGGMREIENARTALLERAGQLAKAYNTKEAELAQAQESLQSLTDKVTFLEDEARNRTQSTEKQIDELNEALRREKVEHAVIAGALEAARKDFTRLMRELMALEQQRNAREPLPELRSANAA
jgi:chromosome segregation ATPase